MLIPDHSRLSMRELLRRFPNSTYIFLCKISASSFAVYVSRGSQTNVICPVLECRPPSSSFEENRQQGWRNSNQLARVAGFQASHSEGDVLVLCTTVIRTRIFPSHGLQHPERPGRDAASGVLSRLSFCLLHRSRDGGLREDLLRSVHGTTLIHGSHVSLIRGRAAHLNHHLGCLTWLRLAWLRGLLVVWPLLLWLLLLLLLLAMLEH